MRILLIDDEALVLKAYARYLEVCMDQNVVSATGGAEALARLEEEDCFDAILCDVSMRGISGVDVHRAVCDHHPELARRFVFLTGGVTNEADEVYIRRSGAPVLEKPVERDAFEKALAEMSGG